MTWHGNPLIFFLSDSPCRVRFLVSSITSCINLFRFPCPALDLFGPQGCPCSRRKSLRDQLVKIARFGVDDNSDHFTSAPVSPTSNLAPLLPSSRPHHGCSRCCCRRQ